MITNAAEMNEACMNAHKHTFSLLWSTATIEIIMILASIEMKMVVWILFCCSVQLMSASGMTWDLVLSNINCFRLTVTLVGCLKTVFLIIGATCLYWHTWASRMKFGGAVAYMSCREHLALHTPRNTNIRCPGGGANMLCFASQRPQHQLQFFHKNWFPHVSDLVSNAKKATMHIRTSPIPSSRNRSFFVLNVKSFIWKVRYPVYPCIIILDFVISTFWEMFMMWILNIAWIWLGCSMWLQDSIQRGSTLVVFC